MLTNEPLFELGSFQLSSGITSSFRINAHTLTVFDWETLADLALSILPPFSGVVGVPTGGEAFAEALLPHATYGPMLVVDDVLTTGKSIRKVADNYNRTILLVAFSRKSSHPGIHAVFTLNNRPAENKESVKIHELVMPDIAEYSTSMPTGEFAGKRWKRKTTDGWILGEYIDDGVDDGTLLIRWTPIEVIPRTKIVPYPSG